METDLSMKKQLPTWDLGNIYKNFSSQAYQDDKKKFLQYAEELKKILSVRSISPASYEKFLTNAVSALCKSEDIFENLYSFAYAVFSTETGNPAAMKELNKLEEMRLTLLENRLLFRKQLGKIKTDISALAEKNPILKDCKLFLEESLFMASHQLSDAEEKLADELNTAGGEAWSRLQEAVSSSASSSWNKKTGERKTVNELRNLAYHSDREIRKEAYTKEIKAWRKMEIPLAYSLNGVKKTALLLDSKRGWKTPVEKSLFQYRMTEKALDTMIDVMEASLPEFRKYLKKKAEYLGLKKLAFYDLFAPITKKDTPVKKWSYNNARKFIIKTFSEFSPDFGSFAKYAFTKNWIDAMPRHGKVGGAYCTSFPLSGESRVLCNYSSSFSGVSTIAHELGHAYHHHILKDESAISRNYPMTLAETASTFAETLIFNTAMEEAKGFEKTILTEMFLQETTQIIVDILSRYYFEKNIFTKIEEGDLSPQEFSILMMEAQKKTYGDAIEKKTFHQYMWAVKSHYYRPELGFYNYPYAFGQLFSIGLYLKYLENPKEFPEIYKTILLMTGKEDIKTVAKNAGFDIESKAFYQKSMNFIIEKINDFCKPQQKII